MLRVNSPPIPEPIFVVGLGCSLGRIEFFNPWPHLARSETPPPRQSLVSELSMAANTADLVQTIEQAVQVGSVRDFCGDVIRPWKDEGTLSMNKLVGE